MSRDQRIDQSATSYCVCKFKTTVRGATYLMTSHVSSALWTLHSILCMYCMYQNRQKTSFNRRGIFHKLYQISKMFILWIAPQRTYLQCLCCGVINSYVQYCFDLYSALQATVCAVSKTFSALLKRVHWTFENYLQKWEYK